MPGVTNRNKCHLVQGFTPTFLPYQYLIFELEIRECFRKEVVSPICVQGTASRSSPTRSTTANRNVAGGAAIGNIASSISPGGKIAHYTATGMMPSHPHVHLALHFHTTCLFIQTLLSTFNNKSFTHHCLLLSSSYMYLLVFYFEKTGPDSNFEGKKMKLLQ